jgi:hypothetical protein
METLTPRGGGGVGVPAPAPRGSHLHGPRRLQRVVNHEQDCGNGQPLAQRAQQGGQRQRKALPGTLSRRPQPLHQPLY